MNKHYFSLKQMLNISTGRLHTKMDDIYRFFNESIEEGIMTHMLPRANEAITGLLKKKYPALPEEGWYTSFWQLPQTAQEYFKDSKDNMDAEIYPFCLSPDEKENFWKGYK